MAEFVCHVCGEDKMEFTWQVFANKTKHIRVSCRVCGTWICWAEQTDRNKEIAGLEPKGE